MYSFMIDVTFLTLILNIDLPYDLAIPLLGIYLKECDSSYSTGASTPIYIAALFTIFKLWKQPGCPTTNVVFIQNGILLSHKEE
jgi:hypothetical protein